MRMCTTVCCHNLLFCSTNSRRFGQNIQIVGWSYLTPTCRDFRYKQFSSSMTNMDSLSFIEDNLKSVNSKILNAYNSVENNSNKRPYLVAVSKLQSKNHIIEAYKHGQRHFGENYIQELFDKANDQEILEKCPQIEWHMIGHIQTNKINKLLDVPNLKYIQTVDSQKLAEALNNHLNKTNCQNKLNILVQVNTSNEDAKSGVSTENVVNLVQFIMNNCNRLNFAGLMTIGAFGFDPSQGINPDFLKLVEVRNQITENLKIPISQIELSMGMSSDFEHAIKIGSTIVRVGTSIFGQRPKKL